MYKKILSYFVSIVVVSVFIIPSLVSGADAAGGGTTGDASGNGQPTFSIKIPNPFNCGSTNCTLYDFLKTIINTIFIPIGGVVAVLMIMWAGFLYVTARGDTGQIKKARDALTWAVVGAAILLGAWVIANAIEASIRELRT